MAEMARMGETAQRTGSGHKSRKHYSDKRSQRDNCPPAQKVLSNPKQDSEATQLK